MGNQPSDSRTTDSHTTDSHSTDSHDSSIVSGSVANSGYYNTGGKGGTTGNVTIGSQPAPQVDPATSKCGGCGYAIAQKEIEKYASVYVLAETEDTTQAFYKRILNTKAFQFFRKGSESVYFCSSCFLKERSKVAKLVFDEVVGKEGGAVVTPSFEPVKY